MTRDILATNIEDTPLPNRARRWLQVAGIKTVGQLVQRTEADLLTIRNFAETSLQHVKRYLAEHDLELANGRARPCSTEWVVTALSDPNFRITKRERHVLQLRHGLQGDHPLTLEETGRVFGLTRERVRQIQKKAEEKVIAFMTFNQNADATRV